MSAIGFNNDAIACPAFISPIVPIAVPNAWKALTTEPCIVAAISLLISPTLLACASYSSTIPFKSEVSKSDISTFSRSKVVIPFAFGVCKAVDPTLEVCLSTILLISSNLVFKAEFSRLIFNRSSSLLAIFNKSSFSFINVS